MPMMIPPILLAGATGTLGRAFVRICASRALRVTCLSRQEADLSDHDAVLAALDRHEPWAVVNAVGYVRVDQAETDIESCRQANVVAPTILAAACAQRAVPLVTFSSDLVFDGAKGAPYQEGDRPAPLSLYGRTKAEAEARVLDRHANAMVVRTSAFFGPWDDYNFATITVRALERGEMVPAARDVMVSPTYIPDLVNTCLDLLIDGESGLWHLSNAGPTSWADFAMAAARVSGIGSPRVEAVASETLGWRAPRPPYSALESERGALLPSLSDALERWATQRAV
jgi:dTDP-4-dehydrorhamnose reductase